MQVLQEAKFHKYWTCEVKDCGNILRVIRHRHHCRSCGRTICNKHTLDNVTLLSSIHQVPTNYKKVCTDCHEKGVADANEYVKNKSASLSLPVEKSTASVGSSESYLRTVKPTDVSDHLDTQSIVSIVSQGVEASHLEYLQKEIDLKNSQIAEISTSLTKVIDAKNHRISELEAKVASQAKELHNIALLVEKRLSLLQNEIKGKDDIIAELQMKNNNTEGDLANKDLEITELQRHLVRQKTELMNSNTEVAVLREQSTSLMNKLVAKSTECQVLSMEEARLKAELHSVTGACPASPTSALSQ